MSDAARALPSPGRTFITCGALVGAAISAAYAVHELPLQMQPSAGGDMFTPGGRLFLSAIIDGGVSIVIIGGTIAEAGVALLLRNRAPRESAGLRYAAAALGGIAGGAAIALLLALGVLLAVRPGMQEDLLMAFSIVGGGFLGCAYEAVFRIRERRARRRHATEALRSSLD